MKDKEFSSESYMAFLDEEGYLTVYQKKPRVIQKISGTPEGGVSYEWINRDNVQSPAEKRLLGSLDKAPVFEARWAGNRRWYVDIDCGAKRFNGTRTNEDLVKALKNYMFDQEQIGEMLATCKSKGTHKSCPRHY